MVQVLLEPQTKLNDSLTYDITAWSLPYAYGLKAIATKEEVETEAIKINTETNSVLSEKMYGYDSEEKKLPMISARNIRGPGTSSFMTSLHTCVSVEKPGMTVPWYCLACLRAPRMASPFAACGVSTMMRLMFMLCAKRKTSNMHTAT